MAIVQLARNQGSGYCGGVAEEEAFSEATECRMRKLAALQMLSACSSNDNVLSRRKDS